MDGIEKLTKEANHAKPMAAMWHSRLRGGIKSGSEVNSSWGDRALILRSAARNWSRGWTLVVSTLVVNTLVVSTLIVSTLSISTLSVSTLVVSTLSVSSLSISSLLNVSLMSRSSLLVISNCRTSVRWSWVGRVVEISRGRAGWILSVQDVRNSKQSDDGKHLLPQ